MRKQPKSGVIRLLKLVWLPVGGWRERRSWCCWQQPGGNSKGHPLPRACGSVPGVPGQVSA